MGTSDPCEPARSEAGSGRRRRIGARPLGCSSAAPWQDARKFPSSLHVGRFCSLKAALLCGGPEPASHGGSSKIRPLAAGHGPDVPLDHPGVADWLPAHTLATIKRFSEKDCAAVSRVLRSQLRSVAGNQ